MFAYDLCHGQIEYLRNYDIEKWELNSENLRNSANLYENPSQNGGATQQIFTIHLKERYHKLTIMNWQLKIINLIPR